MVHMDRAAIKDRDFQDWPTVTVTYSALKVQVLQGVSQCVHPRWRRMERFILQHLHSVRTIHTVKPLRTDARFFRMVTVIWSAVSMMPIPLRCVLDSAGQQIWIMARAWSSWWNCMICIVWMIWHWRIFQRWSADLQILVRVRLWQATSDSESLTINSIRVLILVQAARISRRMQQKAEPLSLQVIRGLQVIWSPSTMVMAWWRNTCIILRFMSKSAIMLRRDSRLVWAVQQAVPQVIICISRSRRMVWLSIHCYILRATEQAVNCSVWTRWRILSAVQRLFWRRRI